MKWVTVNDMYKCSKGNDFPLLSEFTGDFWSDYVSNYLRYDKLFNRMFTSFRYYMQDPVSMCDELTDEHIEEITRDFSYEVFNHLLVNSKKYSELYRVNVVDDDDFSVVDNYNVIETLERETSKSDSNVLGQRLDSESEILGAKINTISETIGAKSESESEQLGSRQDSNSQTLGSRTDSNETTVGDQTNVGTNTIAVFNSIGFENDTEFTDSLVERTDSSETTIGQQINSNTNTIGPQSNSKTIQHGQQINETETELGQQAYSRNFTKGSQTDTYTGSGTEEYTLTRRGNIGVKTASQVMAEHADLWSKWEFYSYIFKEICADLLLI